MVHPCFTTPSNDLILLGVEKKFLGMRLERKFAWGDKNFTWGGHRSCSEYNGTARDLFISLGKLVGLGMRIAWG